MNKKPPQIFLKLLRWFCHPDLRHPIEGDLMELYDERAKESGKRRADWMFALDVFLLLRKDIIRPTAGTYKMNHYGMFKNYFKIGIRNLYKRKAFSLINILGLSIGLTSCLFIMLYVQNEYSYDKYFEDHDRIFKMVEEIKAPEGTSFNSSVPYSFVKTMQEDYAEVESATAFSGPYPNQRVYVLNEKGDKVNFLESGVLLADSNFLSVFRFKMLKGNRQTALRDPNSVVLTETAAKRYFGDIDPLGKFIAAAGKNSIVTGVCEDPPANTHFKFSYLVSSTSVGWLSQKNFNLRRAQCYFKLRSGVVADALERKFPKMVDTYIAKEIERVNKISWKEYRKTENGFHYSLMPLTAIHLNKEVSSVMKAGGNRTFVQILTGIAFLIFCLACINFINLSTARSLERAKEVGIRKVLGSQRIQLIFQFLTESFLLTFLSLLISIGLLFLLLPKFNQVYLTSLAFDFNAQIIWIAISAILLIALMAGMYPAFIISAFKPVNSLKGNISTKSNNGRLKNGLVVFQFWISILLISSTYIIKEQIDFIGNKNLGFDQDQLMVIEGAFHKNPEFTQPFLKEVKNIPGVKGAAGSLWVQGFQGTWSDQYRVEGSSTTHSINRVPIGDDLAELMNLKLADGSFFSAATNDSLFVILNEAAVNQLGVTEPVGKNLTWVIHDDGKLEEVKFTIKGVVKDFNYQSLRAEVAPLVIQSSEKNYGRMSYIVAKIAPLNVKRTIEQIDHKWQEMVTDRPFSFRFMDSVIDSKYQKEKQLSSILMLFSSLSIFIAGIGLFGLSAYAINLRTKEIGIRKVVGASIWNILTLLSKDFMKMILLALLLAIPVGWYSMEEWLSGFAFRINLSINSFLTAGILVLLVSAIVLSVQTFKAALSNPVNSLKDE